MDPALAFSVSTLHGQVIAPGTERVASVSEVEGYRPGADIRFFLYRVSGDRATYAAILDASAAQLASQGYRVEISPSVLGQ